MSQDRADLRATLAAGLLVAALAVDRLHDLAQPLVYDQVTQRALNATFPYADLLAGRYPDARHPPLGYLVLAPFAHASLDEAWLRLPSVGASILALLALYFFARRVTGPWWALLPVALHGLSLGWLAESRSITDLPLLVLLALLSSTALLAALDRPTSPRLAAWALSGAAMCWTWFLAPVVLAAQLVAVAGAARPRRTLVASAALLGMASPMAPRLARVIAEDLQLRQVAALDPAHVWGDRTPLQLLAEASRVVAPSPTSAAATGLLVVLGGAHLWRSGRRPEAVLAAGLPLLACAVAAVATLHVRLQPYYLLFALPFALTGAVAALRGAAGLAVAALLLADAGWSYSAGLSRTLRVAPGDDFPGLAAALAADPRGGDALIVAEPHYLSSTLAWNLLDDPGAAWRACRLSEDRTAQTCGDRMAFLRVTSKLVGDWQREDVDRLRARRSADLWFVEHLPFPNEALAAELAATCTRHAELRGLRLWWCPGAAQPAAHPGAQPDSPVTTPSSTDSP